jgi:hypothetical protein
VIQPGDYSVYARLAVSSRLTVVRHLLQTGEFCGLPVAHGFSISLLDGMRSGIGMKSA